MKLHLPSRLRRALLTCCAALIGMAPTLSTGALLAGGAVVFLLSTPASAVDYFWTLKGVAQPNTTLNDGDRLYLGNGTDTGTPTFGSNETPSSWVFSTGAITVGSGAELWVHGWTGTVNSANASGKMTIESAITLQDGGSLHIQDGSYNFSKSLTVQGNATLSTVWMKYNYIQDLYGDANAVLNLDSGNVQSREPAMWILGSSNNAPTGHWQGTIIVETPSAMVSTSTPERVALVINSGKVLGATSHVVLENCGALWLNANGLTVPNLTANTGITYLRHNASTNNARQTISNITINSLLHLAQLTGSNQVSWVFNSLSGPGVIRWYPWANHYNPSVIYVNGENPDFTGSISVTIDSKSYSGYHPYQRFLQINNTNALSGATVNLTGTGGFAVTYSTLALNATNVNLSALTGDEHGLVYAGTVSMSGTASSPVTEVRPSSTMLSYLTLGAGTLSSEVNSFYGSILEYVHIVKEGDGEQVIATLSTDTTRTVTVAEGTLTLGSIGSLRSLVVDAGGVARVGLNVVDSGKTWGKWQEQHPYTTASAVSVSDTSRFKGNIITTDEIYGTGIASMNYSEEGMTVTRFDATGYTGDTITLKLGALAVFDPATREHSQLDFGTVKRIILESGTGLVAAGPDQTGARDPKIDVTQDLELQGNVYLRAMGTITWDEETGFYDEIDTYNTTYSGSICGTGPLINLIKEDYGTITLAGDMSEYEGNVTVSRGKLILDGKVKKMKHLSGGGSNGAANFPSNSSCSYIELTGNTSVEAGKVHVGDHSDDWLTIERGSVLNITAVENKGSYANSDVYCASSTFLVGNVLGQAFVRVEGTINMLNCGYISTGGQSVIGSNSEGSILGNQSVTVASGGVLNMKGLTLQTWTDITPVDVVIQSGGTLNLGADGLAAYDVNTQGNSKGEGYDNLRLTFEKGSTLGILDSTASWSTTRDITSDGLTVNTQGYIVNTGGSGSASYGSATGLGRTINLGHFQGTLNKMGLGTLRVAANSLFDSLTVNQGFFAVTADASYTTGGVKSLTTNGSGSLLFNLTETIDWNNSATGGLRQEAINILGTVNGTLNITVALDEGASANVSGDYRILDGVTPDASKVHLTALVDDGWTATYSNDNDRNWGVVHLAYEQDAVVGIQDELTWQIGGETNIWANSTDKNWLANGATEMQRFVNGNDTDGYSSVTFGSVSENVTLLDTVMVKDMTVGGAGWVFLGEGSVQGAGTLTVNSGASATFSNTGTNTFQTIDIQQGGTLRLAYLDSTCSNWEGVTFGGAGRLEIATGANHALASTNGLRFGELAELKLSNNTSFDIQTTASAVAESLGNPQKITIEAGSHIGLNANTMSRTNTTGRELHLAGAGNPSAPSEALASAMGIAYHSNYNTPTAAAQNYTINNHVHLDDDATVYVNASTTRVHSGYIAGNYVSNGHVLTKTGDGRLSIGAANAPVGTNSDFSGGFDVQAGYLRLNLLAEGEQLSDTKATVSGPVSLASDSILEKAGGHIELTGGLSVSGSASISSSVDTGLTVSSVVSGNENSSFSLSQSTADKKDVLVLTRDNSRTETADGGTGFSGTWELNNGWTLRAEHIRALHDAVVELNASTSALQLGDAATTYTVRGLDGSDGTVNVKTEGSEKTLEIQSDTLHTYYGGIEKGVSIVMNGKGGQTLGGDLVNSGFDGDITVTAGLLTVGNLNNLQSTNVTIADSNARLASSNSLVLGAISSLTANKNGAVLDVGGSTGGLDLSQGGTLLLGANGGLWNGGDTGLDMEHHSLTLSTTNKALLDLSMSAFLEAGDTVTLFSDVDTLTIDGRTITHLDQLNTLGDYFDISRDINLPGAQLRYTSDHKLVIVLTKDSSGLYWEWKGGNGTWDLNQGNIAWSPKDNLDASVGFQNGYAAYFTDQQNGPEDITVTEDIRVSEMAVREGVYNFYLNSAESLTIENSLYEKENGEAHFFLRDGSTLTIGGETELASSTIQTEGGQSNVATLSIGQKLTLSDQAGLDGVDVRLAAPAGSAAGATLDITDTTASNIAALNGYGTVQATGGELLIDNMKDGSFTGEFGGTKGANGEYNTLTIAAGNGNTQTFEQVKTNDSWNIINNGNLVFNPADGSSLNSLTMGAGSTTGLTLNTDQTDNGLSVSTLTVDKNLAGLTINSTGNTALSREQYTILSANDLVMDDGTVIDVTIGSGVFFKRVDKEKGAYVTKNGNDLVLNVEFTDKNTYADFVSDSNASAGAGMLWDIDSGSLSADSDLARLDSYTYSTVESGNKAEAERIMAAAAGASTAVLGAAFSSDVERQLKAIRNRTTTMGVNQCEVNENMPYFNAWINAEGNFRDVDSDGLQSGYSLNSWGGTVGFDVDINPHLTMGLALTGMYGDLESDGPDKLEGDFDTTYVSAFARVAHRAWVHTFVATVGFADVTADRTVNFGSDSYKAHGSTDGTAFGFMYEVGRTIAMNEDASVCLQPVFNVVFRHSSISGYEEDQTDAGLKVGDQDFTTLTFGLGARMQAVVGENLYNRTSIFEARALLKVDAGDRQGEADVALLHSASQNTYTVKAAEMGAVGIELGAGMSIPVGADDGSIFFDASCELRSGYTDINAAVGYRINF